MWFRCLVVIALASGFAVPAGVSAEGPVAVAHWDARQVDGTQWNDASGHGNAAELHGATLMSKVEDLVERPCLYFSGNGAYAEAPNTPDLNPDTLSIALWFKAEAGSQGEHVPVLLKSLPAHAEPWYQYGLFLMDAPEHPRALSFYVSVGGKACFIEAANAFEYGAWNSVTAAFDGHALRLYVNGQERASRETEPGVIDRQDTPLLMGAYANLPKTPANCFQGFIAEAAVYNGALTPEAVTARFEQEKAAYPEAGKPQDADRSEYAQRLNTALRESRDVWGEALIAGGGATYDNIKDYLRPLFFSTGFTNETLGVHNLLFAEDGGEPPYIIPFADGSRIAANLYNAPEYIECFVGAEGREKYGSVLEHLSGPALDAYYPILRTEYTDAAGVHYRQECFAGRIEGVNHPVAFVRVTAIKPGPSASAPVLRIAMGKPDAAMIRVSAPGQWDGEGARQAVNMDDPATRDLFVIWSPQHPLPENLQADRNAYHAAREACKAYWDGILVKGATFNVPEMLVMNVQRNHLIQNLIMRWRYSLGAVVYSGSFFQPESSDTISTLGLYGFTEACRDGLGTLVGLSKGEAYYSNWERGERLSHGAHYYFLTRDQAFIQAHTAEYRTFCEELKQQIAEDPHGILKKQRHCGDISTQAYCTFHQAVSWRGMRDMAEVWKATGEAALGQEYGALAASFREALLKASASSSKTLPDGTLFVPSMLLEEKEPVYDPITETRIGSYWNLCMPYAFASGLWSPQGEEMGHILDFMHQHGAVMLGLIRFNYYPVPIGAWRTKGLPGYYTTGYDNVYLPSYLRMLSDHDEADRLVLSFYGKLAHGQTRGTFVSGEGETIGTRPPEQYRSCYGTPCSANNTAFLLALRLMLIRESFDDATGEPNGLYLAHATPRGWLEHGQTIEVRDAPTCFGPLSYRIESKLRANKIQVTLTLPERNPASVVRLRLRIPEKRILNAVEVNGKAFEKFDAKAETIELTGLQGAVEITAGYR